MSDSNPNGGSAPQISPDQCQCHYQNSMTGTVTPPQNLTPRHAHNARLCSRSDQVQHCEDIFMQHGCFSRQQSQYSSCCLQQGLYKLPLPFIAFQSLCLSLPFNTSAFHCLSKLLPFSPFQGLCLSSPFKGSAFLMPFKASAFQNQHAGDHNLGCVQAMQALQTLLQ